MEIDYDYKFKGKKITEIDFEDEEVKKMIKEMYELY